MWAVTVARMDRPFYLNSVTINTCIDILAASNNITTITPGFSGINVNSFMVTLHKYHLKLERLQTECKCIKALSP